jgi:hypothetical protein
VVKRAVLAGLFALLGSIAIDAGQPLNVQVTPRLAIAPADVRIYVSIERHADNRSLRVTASSDDFFRSSEIPLDGEESPRAASFYYRDLPPGMYEVRVDVLNSKGETRQTVWSGIQIS